MFKRGREFGNPLVSKMLLTGSYSHINDVVCFQHWHNSTPCPIMPFLELGLLTGPGTDGNICSSLGVIGMAWTSCQIRKIAGCAYAGNAGNVFPATPLRVSDPDMHHDTCVTHVPWCMPGSLNIGFLSIRWWGKRSRHSRRMRNPQLNYLVRGPWSKIQTVSWNDCIYSQSWNVEHSVHTQDVIGGVIFYSETTWAVGIAQLTHHEVQGGGKNPETGGRGIFAPTANRVVS